MFRRIVASPQNPLSTSADSVDIARANALFNLHPSELSALLEMAWDFRVHQNDGNNDLGHPDRKSDLIGLPPEILALFDNMTKVNRSTFSPNSAIASAAATNKSGKVRWSHLIYAYMVENTKVYDIFYKVLEEFLYGEKLGVPTPETYQWLRNTEALFFSDPSPYTIGSIVSRIRPDMGATRRNAYYRMFGMDLNHKRMDGKPYFYPKPEIANNKFNEVFQEFCEEVWVGIVHGQNTSGANITDDANIAYNAKQCFDMLRTRRLNAEISRVEFFSVAMMSWFHLTLQFNSPIVKDLRAEGSNPEQRLFKIARRVGIPAHALSENFFIIADPIARIFAQLETGDFNNETAAASIYNQTSPIKQDMINIITQYSILIGQDLKVRRGKNVARLAASNAR